MCIHAVIPNVGLPLAILVALAAVPQVDMRVVSANRHIAAGYHTDEGEIAHHVLL